MVIKPGFIFYNDHFDVFDVGERYELDIHPEINFMHKYRKL